MSGLLALALIAVLPGRGATQAPEPLFVDLGLARSVAALGQAPASSPAVVERLAVGMRLDRLFAPAAGAQPLVRLNIGDRFWVARFERLDHDTAGFRSWVGALDDVEYSHVVFTERDGVVSGLINAVSSSYQIRTVRAGLYLVEQLTSAGAGREWEPVPGSDGPAHLAADVAATPADDGSQIDVLMLYTPNARNAAGGVSQIQSIASQIISDSNTIYGRSGISTRVHLVGTSELAQFEASTVLADLTAVSNSASAQALRDSTGADLVQLLVSSPDSASCGIAYLLGSLSSTNFNAYSVVDIACVAQYSPTHEMGHNMGSQHAPEDDPSGGLFSYSYGFKDPVNGFRTVMAYACSNANCPRIANFSNPSVSQNGGPMGTASQNNSLSINNAALTVANFRQSFDASATSGGPSALLVQVAGSTVTASWGPPTDGSTPASYRVEISLASTNQQVAIVNVGTATVFSATLVNGSYLLRVRATYANGTSVATSDVPFTIGPITINNAPLAPQDLRAELSALTVALLWNVHLASAIPTSFIIDVGTAPSLSNLGSFDTGAIAFRLDAARPAPGIYYVRVRARNAFGISPPSNEVKVTVTGGGGCSGAPVAPTGLNATVVGSFVTFNWGQPVSATPVTGFTVEAGSAPGVGNIGQFPVGATTIFAASAPPGTYYVRVRATNACGQSVASNEVAVVVP